MAPVLLYLEDVQRIILLLFLLPVGYWVFLSLFPGKYDHSFEPLKKEKQISIILPMRNEIKNVKRKLRSIISEVAKSEHVELFIVVSDSSDGTLEEATKFLNRSDIHDKRWSALSFEKLGKNVSLNWAISQIEADIIIISDADAKIRPGWLKIISSRLGEDGIGVVSGIEDASNSSLDGFQGYYRSKSNWFRIRESKTGSTPVLEGSIIGWDTHKIGEFRFNEGLNADDAQLGMIAARRGLRAVIDPRISFEDFDHQGRSTEESVRRAQGLSLVLIKNADILFKNIMFRIRLAILNSLFIYVILPWLVILFGFSTLVTFLSNAYELNMLTISSVGICLGTPMIPQGRMLLIGVAISIKAHLQAIFGIKYNTWEPRR